MTLLLLPVMAVWRLIEWLYPLTPRPPDERLSARQRRKRRKSENRRQAEDRP